MERLKAALMGLAGAGAEYLAALQADEQFELVAVADTDPECLRRYTEGTALKGYEDYRSLVVESAAAGLDLLVVALEPFQALEFVELAAQRRIGVFHKAPLARTVREGQALADRFATAELPLVVSRPWQSEPAFAALADLDALAGRVHTATAEVWTMERPDGWRGDWARAGGGGLLNGAYEQVDLLVTVLGIPESVYAQCSMAAAPQTARKYDTEDAATVVLRFAGERIAGITVCRGAPEPYSHVAFFGTERLVEVYPDRMTITPGDGRPPESHAAEAATPTAGAIRSFGAARRAGGRRLASSAREHLAAIAVIEAAYLSAKTDTPESPSRLLS